MTPSKVPVVNRPEYTIWLENVNNQAVFIHCDVYKWSKTAKVKIEEDVQLLLRLQNGPFFALHNKQDLKHKKFLGMFNFEYVKDIDCTDKTQKEIYMVIGESDG